MSHPYQITVSELEGLMRQALKQCDFPPDYQERYVAAHQKYGWLRPETHPDILALAEIHYTLPSIESLGPIIPPIPTPPRHPRRNCE
jgi:hypothetical protein